MSGTGRVDRPLRRVLLSCILGMAASGAGAVGLVELPGLARSEVVDARQLEDSQRVYPLGPLRRVSNQIRYEAQVEVHGRQGSATHALADGQQGREAFASVRKALQEQGGELLYWCEGRDCGSSALWANTVFGNARLYGPDEQQAYLLLRLAAPNENSLIALYGITRGNRRGYLHAERVDSADALGDLRPAAGTLLRQLRDGGELRLARQEPPNEAWSELLANALNLDSTLRVSLAGAHAEAWREALVRQRVRAARLELDPAADERGLLVRRLR